MDWNHKIEQHRTVLRRIVALLFALADLADRATSRSRRVRCEVLFILSHGEAVAREFILEEAEAAGTPILYLLAPASDCRSSNDAMQMAARFRALAVALAYILCMQALPAKRQSPRYFMPSDRPARPTCQILHKPREIGFRALDSPFRPSA